MSEDIKLKFILKKEVHQRLIAYPEWLLCWISKSHQKSVGNHTTVLWFYPYETYIKEITTKRKFDSVNFIPIHVSTNKLTEFLPGYVYTNDLSLIGYGLDSVNDPTELNISDKCLLLPVYVQSLEKILGQYDCSDWSQLPIPSSVVNTPCILIKKASISGVTNFILPCSIVAQSFFFVTSRMINLILSQDLFTLYKVLSEPYISQDGERTIEVQFEKNLSKAEELFIAFISANPKAGRALQTLSRSIISNKEAYLFTLLPSLKMNLFVNYYLVNNHTAIVNQILDHDCDLGFDCLISSYSLQAKEEKNKEKREVNRIPMREIDTSGFELVIDEEAKASTKNNTFIKATAINKQEYFLKKEPTIKKSETIDLKALSDTNRIGIPVSVGQVLERISTSPYNDNNSDAGRAIITTDEENEIPAKQFYTLFVNAMSRLKGHGCTVEYFNNSKKSEWQDKEIKIPLKFQGTTRNQVGLVTRLSCEGQTGIFYFIEIGNPLHMRNHYLGQIFVNNLYEINIDILREIVIEVAKKYGNWSAVAKTKLLEKNSIVLRRFEHQDFNNENFSALNAANKILAYLSKEHGWTLQLISDEEESNA